MLGGNAPVKRREMVGVPHLWSVKRQFQLDFLRDQGLEADHYLLDVGCGTLRGGAPLIAYLDPGRYYGIEKRPEVLAEGIEELETHGLQDREPVLVTAPGPSDVSFPVAFDVAWAYSVLFHLEDPELRECLSFVRRHLVEDGTFFANVEAGDREKESWKEFPVVWRTVERYRKLGREGGFEVEDLGSLRSLGQESGLERDDEQRMLQFRPRG